MNVHTGSTPSLPGSQKGFGFKPIVFAISTGLVLATVVVAGLSRRDASEPTVTAPAVSEAAAAPPIPAPRAANPSGRTYYIVDSEVAASTLLEGISAAEAIALSLGSAPVQETVVVLTSDNEVQSFAESIADGNRTLVALGFAEDRVVDLRGR